MPAVNHELLRRRRDELDLSNGSLAARMKTKQRYVENIVQGRDNPSMRVIYRLSRALDLPVEDIVLGDKTPHGDPSEPPVQPKQEPKAPPSRTAKEKTSGPKRPASKARVA